jgi:quercetin dioxygenase-like cupin family protein
MKAMLLPSAIVLLVGAGFALYPAPARQSGVTRTELQRGDLEAAGREVVQVRVELAPGVAFGDHWHPGEEIIYVLEGTFEYEVAGRPPVTLEAGEVLFVPARTVHAARNVGRGRAVELATYVLEKGKPPLVLVK